MIHNLAKIPGAIRKVPGVIKIVRKVGPAIVGIETATTIGEGIDVVVEEAKKFRDNVKEMAENMPQVEITENPGVPENSKREPLRPSKYMGFKKNPAERACAYVIDGTINSVIGGAKGFVNGLLMRSDVKVRSKEGFDILFCVIKDTTTGSVNVQSSPAMAAVIKYIIFRAATTIIVIIVVTLATKKIIDYTLNNFIYRDKVDERKEMEKEKQSAPYSGDTL